ncbi:MAG: GGDEF domain-containing protein [Candidatus Dormibacteraeota bacterium]|nr:GGDEF domain-containing protein [Candidatus Dormibacteraeota bacterium]
MTGAGAALSHINAAGFALIGALAVAAWVRWRGRTRAWLAAALGLLALVSAGGELSAVVKQTVPIVPVLDLIFFMASAYALVELRNTLLPVSLRARLALLALLIVSTALAVPLALGPQNQKPSTFALIVVCALVVEWALCVIEPALRFRLAARRLAVVQRKRLRALSTGYLGIAGALVVAVGTTLVAAAASNGKAQPVNSVIGLALQVVVSAAVPWFYVGFAPPRWLRRHWREAETGAYRGANAALLTFADDVGAMAARAVEWAMRFVGARAGLLLGPDGSIVASQGDLPLGQLDGLVLRVRRSAVTGPRLLDGNLAVVPMPTKFGEYLLVVVASAFSPLFGSDELVTLSEFAASVSVAMARVHLSVELRATNERTNALLEALSELGAGLLVSESGRVVYVNDAFAAMSGYSAKQLEGTDVVLLSPEAEREVLAEQLAGVDNNSTPWHNEGRLLRRDGRVVEVETVVHTLSGQGTRRRIALIKDISARKKAERLLADAARLDPLTGVGNRRAWNEQLTLCLSRAEHRNEPLSVALLDLDGFKEFNDDWGHQRGDQLLVAVAQGWRAALRDEDFLARYGGDEFAVLMPGCTADEGAAVVQRLTDFTPERASAGVAQWDGCESGDALLARADSALLRSKRERIGSVTVASLRSGDRASGWVERLEGVLERRLVRSAYQPIVRFDTGKVMGYEALLRPAGADAGTSVEELFAAAQKLGYSRDLDWVSRRAALEGAGEMPDGTLLFVNVSARALLDPVHGSDQMLMLLRWTERLPSEVVLEISEREVIRNLARLRSVLAEYRRHGFRFALDDVGEGHSTLEVLEAAEAEFIKVARRLTEHVDEPSSAGAVRAVVTFAEASGATLIAEGISDLRMVESMQQFGIRYGQGFALGLPAFFAHSALRLQEEEPAV